MTTAIAHVAHAIRRASFQFLHVRIHVMLLTLTYTFTDGYDPRYGLGITWMGADGTITAELYTGSTEAAIAAEGMLGIFPRFDPESPMAELAYEAVMKNRTWEATLNVSGVVEPFNPWVRALPPALSYPPYIAMQPRR